MAEVADLYVRLRADTRGFTAAMRGAAAEGEGVAARMHAGMKGVAAFGVYGAAAIIGVAAASVEMGSKFQANIQRVNTLAMGGKGNIKQLEDGVLSLAGQVGYSPNSLSKALYHIESNFYSVGLGGKQAFSALKVAAQGAQIGGADLVDTTNALGAAVASGIPGVSNYAGAMQQLLNIVGSGDMTMQNLADALGTGVLAVVKQYGASLTDAGAALATFGDNNIRGQVAATDLRMAIMDITKPAKGGEKALAALGIKSGELGNDLRKHGLLSAISDLRQHLIASKVPASEWGKVMMEAFTKKSSAPLAILLGQFDRLKSKYKVLNSGAGDFGNAWKSRLGTVQQQVDNLKGKFEAWLTELGLKLLPFATKALAGINKGLTWLTQHQEVLKTIGVAAGTVLAVGLGMAAMAAAELVFDFLLVAVPIAAVAAGIYLLWTHCATFRNIVKEVAKVLMGALKASFDWMKNTALPDLIKAWHATWQGISDVITWFINDPIAWVKKQIKMFQDFWKLHGDSITTIATKAWQAIWAIVQLFWSYIKDFLKLALIALQTAWQVTWDLVTGIVKTAWALIKDTVHTAFQVFLDAVGLFADALTGKWGRLWTDVKKLVHDAWSGIQKIFTDFASGAGHMLVSAGGDLIHGLIKGIKSAAGSVVSLIKQVGKDIVNGVKSFFGIHSPSTVFAEIGGHLMGGLVKGIGSSASDVHAILGHVFGSAGGGAARAFGLLKNAGSSVLKDVFGGAFGGLKNLGGDIAGFLGSMFSGGGGGGGVGRWASTINQALAMAGMPAGWAGAISSIIMHESGGNPNAINLTDSNAAAGHPSQGLMQTIPSTFAAYAGPLASRGITNPLANIYAGIRYIMSTYGSVFNVPGIRSMARGGGYMGYAAGTPSAPPGWAWVGENGPELMRFAGGEKVLSHTASMRHHLRSRHHTVHHHVRHHHIETPAQLAKKRQAAERKAARHARSQAHKHAAQSIKHTHQFLQRLLNTLASREHHDVQSRAALSKYVTGHNGKHFTAAAKHAALAKWNALEAHDKAIVRQALDLQHRIDHTRHATTTERRSAASKVTAARRMLTEMQSLHHRIEAMKASNSRHHKVVRDHIKKVEKRRQGSHQAIEQDQIRYLAAMSRAGRLGHNKPPHLGRITPPVFTHHVPIPPLSGPGRHPLIEVHAHLDIDGREVAKVVQKHTLRHENRNANNGLSRYTKR